MSTQKTSTPVQDSNHAGGIDAGKSPEDQEKTSSTPLTQDSEETESSYGDSENADVANEEAGNDPRRIDRTLEPERENDPTRIRKDANDPEKVDPTRIRKSIKTGI